MEGSHAHGIQENGRGHRHVRDGEYDTYTGWETVADNLYIDSNTGSHNHSISGSVSFSGNHAHGIQDAKDGHRHPIDSALLQHWHTFNSGITGSIKVNNSEKGMSGFSHSHNFKIKAHAHNFSVPDHTHTFDMPDHEHKFDLPDHEHKFDLPGHKHKFNIPDHQHNMKIGKHQHDIEPGIFTSGNPTQADLIINGTKKATITTVSTELDITEYLKRDEKVPRGEWIEIRIKPTNAAPNNMAYISVFGNVFAFIQSYTGGNF